jgi:AAA domain, putative AbiEii toxin, Type IV TA system
MWHRVTIKDFRAFEHFELRDLGRVNLLVGANNSGKTSVLEAIDLLTASGAPRRFWSTLARRGETVDDDSGSPGMEVDVTHLFRGHRAGTFEVHGANSKVSTSLTATLRGLNELTDEPIHSLPLFPLGKNEREPRHEQRARRRRKRGKLTLAYRANDEDAGKIDVPVGANGVLDLEDLQSMDRRPEVGAASQFVTTRSLDARQVVELFSRVVLTDEEPLVLDALRTVEPSIERMATVPGNYYRERGGLMVKCSGIERRVPIGSLGDGIWRLLTIALCLVRARDGILLVDEIDTGLHYTVLSKMWTLVLKTAERLNVQVFATTHSRDCYEALSVICREEPTGGSQVSIQRIERGNPQAVAFTEREIRIAAEREIEVR